MDQWILIKNILKYSKYTILFYPTIKFCILLFMMEFFFDSSVALI